MMQHCEQFHERPGSEESVHARARHSASQACIAEVNHLRQSGEFKSTASPESKGDSRSSESAYLTIPPMNECRTSTGERQKQTDLTAEQKRLEGDVDALVDKNILNSRDSAQFKADMNKFKERAKEQGLSTETVAKTYSQVSRILEAKGDQPLSQKDRVRAATDIMAIAADPSSNNQGNHNTCNVTALENRLFTRQPDVAAGLIADVATTGKFTAKDGTTVSLDKESLTVQPDAVEAAKQPRSENHRNYASQLFQVTAINLLYEKDPETAGKLRYSQGPERPPRQYGRD